jgi:hypothetical protein
MKFVSTYFTHSATMNRSYHTVFHNIHHLIFLSSKNFWILNILSIFNWVATFGHIFASAGLSQNEVCNRWNVAKWKAKKLVTEPRTRVRVATYGG